MSQSGATHSAAAQDVHVPVLLAEAIDALQPRAGGRYLDCTFGRGGHTQALLARIGDTGQVLALDRDPRAVAAGRRIMQSEPRLKVVHAPFGTLAHEVEQWGALGQVDGILFDLGLSSPQLDDAARGFSLMRDGPLDMRMDAGRGESAAAWLERAETREIEQVLRDFGEERYARRIARAVVARRAERAIDTTGQLVEVVLAALPAAVRRNAVRHPATRVFQALRIQVNRELEELGIALPQARRALRQGGRLAVISFHSLEDRIVKRVLRGDGLPAPPRGLPVRGVQASRSGWLVVGRAQRPSPGEVERNPRARSATLRVAERVH